MDIIIITSSNASINKEINALREKFPDCKITLYKASPTSFINGTMEYGNYKNKEVLKDYVHLCEIKKLTLKDVDENFDEIVVINANMSAEISLINYRKSKGVIKPIMDFVYEYKSGKLISSPRRVVKGFERVLGYEKISVII